LELEFDIDDQPAIIFVVETAGMRENEKKREREKVRRTVDFWLKNPLTSTNLMV